MSGATDDQPLEPLHHVYYGHEREPLSWLADATHANETHSRAAMRAVVARGGWFLVLDLV